MNITDALKILDVAIDLNFRAGIPAALIRRMAEDLVQFCAGDDNASIRQWADNTKAEIEAFGDFPDYDSALWIACAVRWALD